MIADLKIYGIVGILALLAIGYFVYITYRDTMIMKNEIKEMKELMSIDDLEEDLTSESEGEGEEGEEDCEGHAEEEEEYYPEQVYEDVNNYFETIQELPEEEPVIQELTEEPSIVQEQVAVLEHKKYKKKKKNVE